MEDDGVDDMLNEDIEWLKQAVLNERASPEILPFAKDLILTVKDQLKTQQSIIDEAADGVDERFAVSLYQMEIDRVRYLLSTYLRTRLFKIQKYALHILATATLYERLSEAELEFAKDYVNLLEGHYKSTVLHVLPEKLRRITDQTVEVNMVREPDLDAYVFCRVLQDVAALDLSSGGDDARIDAAAGDVCVVRYSSIRPLVLDGSVHLL